MMKRAFLFFGLVLANCSFDAICASTINIGSPLITNYTIENYLAHPQNWAIIQDDRGIMYFANGDGVLVYDGNVWDLVELPNKIPARALGKDSNGNIYTAGSNEFGYIQPNSKGKLEYISLVDSLGIKNLGTFKDILTTDSCVYFRSEEYIIRLNSIGLSHWKTKSTYSITFLFNKELFVQDEKYGLFKLVNDSLVLAPSGRDFIGKKFYFAKQLHQEVVLANRIMGLYKYYPESPKLMKLEHIVSPANQSLINDFVYSGSITRDGKVVLGTNSGGCIVINSKGDILTKITRETGILHNKIHYVYIDRNENLWLALDKGISHCDFSGPISFWNERHGLEGIVQTLIEFNGTLYIGTLQGLFYLKDSKIYKIQSSVSQIWSFLVYNTPQSNKQILLVGALEGVYVLDNNQLSKISNTLTSFKLLQSKVNPNIVYFGSEQNLGILECINEHFEFKGFIDHSGISVRSIVEEPNGEIWLGTYRDGVIHVLPSDNLLSPKEVVRYGLKSGLPSLKNLLVYYFNKKVVFATEKGFYHFVKAKNSFNRDTTLGEIFSEKNKEIFNFIEDSKGGAYLTQLSTSHGSIGYAARIADGRYQWNSREFNKMPRMMLLVAYLDKEYNLWFGGSEGLFRFDRSTKERIDTVFNTFIRNVTINRDSSIFFGNYFVERNGRRIFTSAQSDASKYNIKYHYNSIKFNYSAPDFNDELSLNYKFFLEGYDNKWSDWSSATAKEYTNLSEGNYRFRVISKNIYDITGKESSFEFTILPPWYRTKLSFILYLIFSVLFIMLIVRISIRKLKDTNTYLEEQVHLRTNEINQQKEELLTQSEELLAVSEELERKNFELEKLSIVASKTDNAIVIMDGQGNFEWVNEGFTNMYGLTFDEFIVKRGKNIFDVTSTPEIKEKLHNCLVNKESVYYEFHYVDDLQRNVWAQTTITPILDDNENIIKLIAIDSDITNLKLAEREIILHKTEIESQRDYSELQNAQIEQQNYELENHRTNLERLVRERTNELEIAKEHAEESDRLKSAFLANMSHEIRTPMNAIVGFSNLFKQPNLGHEEIEEFINQITLNSNTLLQLIDDILDVSRIEAGQLKINRKIFNLNKLLTDLFEVFQEKKNNQYNKNLELKLVLGVNESSFRIFSDQLRIQQIITNLVDNALKFTDAGSVEFGYVLVKATNVSKIKFYVKDTGIGMHSDQCEIIFNRFTKIENFEKFYRGAGLGLAICKKLVNLLDGEVHVESKPEHGSLFYFIIPIQNVDEPETGESIKPEIKKTSDFTHSLKTILVAEDENSNFRLIQVFLNKSNLNIIRAIDGKDAIDKFRKNHIDLILMDIKMPIMNGLEATREIKKINKDIPIIALTAYAMQNDEIICIEAGCSDYIAKPIQQEKLVSLLNMYLS